MKKEREPTDRQSRRELLDGHAFLTMQVHSPLWLIASVANVTEAEVLRLIELAKSAGFRA